ncbi:hypothetical protein [Geobacillus sp. PK12]|uniref:hypothetical protein n=1 Tax=Geobacillus sp. PK12 TaxID=2508525 RepID=UPI00101151F8|nr:hypothetical protein [Geobacillus sp. PK12]RXS91467.1 hypothetical protein ETR37_02800 [Geobacillus sp. PK12]
MRRRGTALPCVLFCSGLLFRVGFPASTVCFGAEKGTMNVKLKTVNNNNDENETSIHCQIKKKALTIRMEEAKIYFKNVNNAVP